MDNSRDIGHIGHNTPNKDIPNKQKTTQKTKKMSNTDTTKI